MAGVTTSAILDSDNTLRAREEDFVTRFGRNWTALSQILGIMRPIRKTPGTQLVAYEAAMVDNALQGGAVNEGEAIPATQFKVVETRKADIVIGKYKKAVSIEAVSKYGAAVAIEKTDEQFLVELQNKVMNDFYTFLKSGTLTGTQKTWQRALSIAKGAVLDKFAGMNRTVTDVVGFANIMDLYNYIGDATVSVQTQFGMQYVKDFMGYSTLFLLPDSVIAQGQVIACPVENIDLYYVDPSDSDFAKLGLSFTTEGETNLIGFHAAGNYANATGESYALMGIKLWAEYLDGVCVITVGNENVGPTNFKELTVTSAAGTASGDTKITVAGAPAGSLYKYKVATAAQTVAYDDDLSAWTSWDGAADITAASGKKITVAWVDADAKARGVGNATVVAKG